MPISARPLRSLPWLATSQSPSKAVAVRTPKSNTSPQDSGLWLDGLITATTAVRDASDFAAFPYVRLAANLVLQVLQAIQSVRKNQDDFQELAQNLVQIITTIRDTLRSYFQDYRPPHLFVTQCQAFIDSLLNLLSRVNDVARHSQSWTRYLKASTIQDTIGQYRKQLDGLRANFTLTTIIHLSVKIFSERTPRQLGYTWEHSEPVRLIDAMNIAVDLPLDLCSTSNDLADLIKFLFRKRRGRSYVERGQYALTMGDKDLQRIDNKLWRKHVRPGHTIAMDILIRKSDTKTEVECCPSCSHQCLGSDASLPNEITCSSCATIFRVSRSTEDVNSFAPFTGDRHLQGEGYDNSEEADVKYFRRFHVVLENPIPLSRFVTPATNLWASYPSDEFDPDYLEGTNFERDVGRWLNPDNFLDFYI